MGSLRTLQSSKDFDNFIVPPGDGLTEDQKSRIELGFKCLGQYSCCYFNSKTTVPRICQYGLTMGYHVIVKTLLINKLGQGIIVTLKPNNWKS